MGLDTSHDCWHGPYSAFTRWRNCIAKAAGYDVRPVPADDGMTWDTADIPWDDIERDNPNVYQGEWRVPPKDALWVLLAHSDCDGVLRPAQARDLANRLVELAPAIEAECQHHDLDCHVEKTRQFIKGLRAAVTRGEDVEFH